MIPQFSEAYGVDFETTYAKGRDIKELGVVAYLAHPDTKIYLCSIEGPGVRYAGSVEGAPWHLINGKHWVSHNAGFDIAVFIEAVKRGQIPVNILPSQWDCTANLAAFLGWGRSLAKSVEGEYGVILGKEVRDEMKGKTWETMTPEFRTRALAYAAGDAYWCWRIWYEHAHKWSDQEIEASRHTVDMCLRGVAVNLERAREHSKILTTAMDDCTRRIPWYGESDAKGKLIAPTSINAIKRQCVILGIPPPRTTKEDSEEFDAWIEEYADQGDFVLAVKEYRSLNRTKAVLQKFISQTQPDGRLSYSLKYFGAHTGRWSGASGLNFHNFTKRKIAGVDMRGSIVPGPGKKFVIADLRQIEARVALWYARDFEQLQMIEAGMDVYEVHARRTMGYNNPMRLEDYCAHPDTPERDRNIRQFAKVRVLGLGFGLGYKKFVSYTLAQIGIRITPSESHSIVTDFRRKNRGITQMWDDLEMAMRRHVASQAGKHHTEREEFKIELPSGRCLHYWDPNTSSGLRCRTERGGHVKYVYGGLLFENVVQATARDIIAEGVVRIEKAGYPVVLHVHDEIIAEVDMGVDPSVIKNLLIHRPDWAMDLPIDSSTKVTDRYMKG